MAKATTTKTPRGASNTSCGVSPKDEKLQFQSIYQKVLGMFEKDPRSFEKASFILKAWLDSKKK